MVHAASCPAASGSSLQRCAACATSPTLSACLRLLTPHPAPRPAPPQVPGFPMPKYRLHKRNFQLLCSTQFDSLDWSFACPGVMLDSPASSAQGGSGVQAASLPPPPPARVSVDELPFPLPGWAALLPTPLLLPALAAIKDRLVGPSYGEVAAAMVAHLAPGGPLRHRRVGFAAAGAAGTAAASESSSEDLGS